MSSDKETSFGPEFRGFWDELRRGRLSFPICRACGKRHWYPMKRCPHCQSAELDWRPVGGAATLYTWSVVRHPFTEDLKARVPVTIGLVEFADAPGIRLITELVDLRPEQIRIGMALRPIFPTGNEPCPKVLFRAA
jgi:uncharacterized OB-fold protein